MMPEQNFPEEDAEIVQGELIIQKSWLRSKWFYGIATLILLAFVGMVAAGSGLVWLMYETGNYKSPNKICLSGPARRMALEAIAAKPGSFLYVQEVDHFDYRISLVTGVSSSDRVVSITERGVPLKIDAQPYENYFDLMKPAIVHDGRSDNTQGYEIRLRGLR
jgi:hypothetical protein